MADKPLVPKRDKIGLEYLSGGVTYRQLEAKYGIDHARIHYWVMHHRGIVRNRPSVRKSDNSTNQTPPPLPPPLSLPLPVDSEKVKLAQQLREAELTIALLREVVSIAQTEQGLVVPKKFTVKPSKLWDKTNS